MKNPPFCGRSRHERRTVSSASSLLLLLIIVTVFIFPLVVIAHEQQGEQAELEQDDDNNSNSQLHKIVQRLEGETGVDTESNGIITTSSSKVMADNDDERQQSPPPPEKTKEAKASEESVTEKKKEDVAEENRHNEKERDSVVEHHSGDEEKIKEELGQKEAHDDSDPSSSSYDKKTLAQTVMEHLMDKHFQQQEQQQEKVQQKDGKIPDETKVQNNAANNNKIEGGSRDAEERPMKGGQETFGSKPRSETATIDNNAQEEHGIKLKRREESASNTFGRKGEENKKQGLFQQQQQQQQYGSVGSSSTLKTAVHEAASNSGTKTTIQEESIEHERKMEDETDDTVMGHMLNEQQQQQQHSKTMTLPVPSSKNIRARKRVRLSRKDKTTPTQTTTKQEDEDEQEQENDEDRSDVYTFSSSEEDDRTLLDLFGQVAKEYLTKQVIPPTDEDCVWDWRSVRCEPACSCHLSLQKGDYHLGRSCRLRDEYLKDKEEYVCDPSVELGWLEKPAAKRFISLMEQTASILQDKTGKAVKSVRKHSHSAQQHVCHLYALHKLQQEQELSAETASLQTLSRKPLSDCPGESRIVRKKTLVEKLFCGPKNFVVCPISADGDAEEDGESTLDDDGSDSDTKMYQEKMGV